MVEYYGLFFACLFILVLLVQVIKEILNFRSFNMVVNAEVLESIVLNNDAEGTFKIKVNFSYELKKYEISIHSFASHIPKVGDNVPIRICVHDLSTAKYYGKGDRQFYLVVILEIAFIIFLVVYVLSCIGFVDYNFN